MIFRGDAVMPYTSGLPRDIAVNTFHFDWDETGDISVLGTVMESFYNDVHGTATEPLSNWLSSVIARDVDDSLFKIYVVGTPGPPLGESSWQLGPPGDAQSLPLEVAACLSYRGSTPGVLARRLRGRIYLGPLTIEATSAGSGVAPVVHTSMRASMLGAATFLAGNPTLAAEGLTWGVYSRTLDAIHPITGGWVDNAFDTQRRRQVDATVREAWVLA
jgi:hypothetical protein